MQALRQEAVLRGGFFVWGQHGRRQGGPPFRLAVFAGAREASVCRNARQPFFPRTATGASGDGYRPQPDEALLQGEGGNGGAPSRAGDGGPVPLLKTCEGPPPGAAVLLHEKVPAAPAVQRQPLRIGFRHPLREQQKNTASPFFHLFACLFLMQVRNSKE